MHDLNLIPKYLTGEDMLISHDGNKQEILDMVEEFAQAFARADADALDALLTEDYIHTNADGGVLDKHAWLSWIRTRREELAAGRLKIESYANADVEVRIFGNAAVVTGRNSTQGYRDDRPFTIQIRFTHVWVFEQGQWRRAAFHDTHITQ